MEKDPLTEEKYTKFLSCIENNKENQFYFLKKFDAWRMDRRITKDAFEFAKDTCLLILDNSGIEIHPAIFGLILELVLSLYYFEDNNIIYLYEILRNEKNIKNRKVWINYIKYNIEDSVNENIKENMTEDEKKKNKL